MKRFISIVLVIAGWLLVIYSLVTLARLFDLLSVLEGSSENLGYIFGSILAPMLLIAIARWMIRKGMKTLKPWKRP